MRQLIASAIFFLGLCILFRSLLNLIPALKQKRELKKRTEKANGEK